MDSPKAYGIIANSANDRTFRIGAKCWIIGGTGGVGYERFVWYGMSLGGRKIKKWSATKHFVNFRAAWIPPHINATAGIVYISGTKEEMVETAEQLKKYVHNECDIINPEASHATTERHTSN